MSSIINTNLSSLNSQRNLSMSQSSLATSLQRLSSGLRINSAKDDAAGLAIASRMTSQINGMSQAVRNANDAISLSQTAEGALSETTNLLQRMRELSIQSANASNSASDRKSLQSEVNQLKSELDRIASTTNFNGNKLLDGTFTSQNFQIGADANQTIAVSVSGATGTILGVNSINSNNTYHGVSSATATVTATTNGTGMAATTSGATYTAALGTAIANQTITVTNAAGTANTDVISADAGRSAKAIAAALTAIGSAGGVTSATAASNLATLDFTSTAGIQDGDTVTFSLKGDAGDATPTEAISFVRDTTTYANISAQVVAVVNAGTKPTGITVAANGANQIDITGAGGVNIGVENFASQDNAGMTLNLAGGLASVTAVSFSLDGNAISRTLASGGTYANADATALAASITAAGGGSLYRATATGTSLNIVKLDGTTLALTALAQTGGAAGQLTATVAAAASGGAPTNAALATGGTITSSVAVTTVNSAVAFGATGGTAATLTEGGATDSAVLTGSVSIVLQDGATLTSSVATAGGSVFTSAASTDVSVKTGLSDVSGGNNVAAQTLTIIGSANSTVAVTLAASAKNIATAVNAASGTTGVTATATTTATLASLSANGTVTFNLYGTNTTATSVSATVTTSDMSSLVTAINDKTGNTGITATLATSGTSITLTNANGEDIKIENFTHSASTAGGGGTVQSMTVRGGSGNAVTLKNGGTTTGDSTVVGGTVTFNSNDSSFSIQSNLAATAGGLFTGAAAAAQASTLASLSAIDISTASGAQSALSVIDGALTSVNSIRASLGALQNRFQSTISSLQTTSENISGARSRIQDADFASETAALTRGQILQQAGTAMLAQANSLPNSVLSLLKG